MNKVDSHVGRILLSTQPTSFEGTTEKLMKRSLIALATVATVSFGAVAPAQAEESSSPLNYITGSFTGSSNPGENGWSSSGSSQLDILFVLAAIAGIAVAAQQFAQGGTIALPPQIEELRAQLSSQ